MTRTDKEEEGKVHGDAGADLTPDAWEPQDWDPANPSAALKKAVAHVTNQARSAITWYISAKRWKQRFGRLLRASAILLGTIAGILPMLGQAYGTPDGKQAFQPVWSSVALAVAAALVLLDRFFGLTSAWIRYVTTELKIRQVLEEFQMDNEIARAAWTAGQPSADQVQQMLARCKAFVTQVQGIVVDETSMWAREFQDTLKQLSADAASAKSTATEPGAVNVTVPNGGECAAGWNLTVDGGTPRHFSGTSAALTGLTAGVHLLAAAGTINGTSKRAQVAAPVAAGGVASASLTLT
jgi:hypothetical protein